MAIGIGFLILGVPIFLFFKRKMILVSENAENTEENTSNQLV